MYSSVVVLASLLVPASGLGIFHTRPEEMVPLDLSRTAFVVRLSGTEKDKANVGRLTSWCKELHEKAPDVDFWMSFDATIDDEKKKRMQWQATPALGNLIYEVGVPAEQDGNVKMNLHRKKEGFSQRSEMTHTRLQFFEDAFKKSGCRASFHVYSEKDMLKAFPKLQAAADRAKEACKGQDWCDFPMGWQFHSEALGLWWNANQEDYDSVWVSEPDMTYKNGKLVDMIEGYAKKGQGKYADLITMVPSAYPINWVWKNVATDAFNIATSSSSIMDNMQSFIQSGNMCTRKVTVEYIQRFSKRLLATMGKWCGEYGRCAHSEAVPATVAACEGYKIATFDPLLIPFIRHDGGPLR